MRVPRFSRRCAALVGAMLLPVMPVMAAAAETAPPGPVFTLSSQPNAAGWVTAPVTVTVSCTGSFTPEPAAFGPFGEEAAGVVTSTCFDAAGGVRTAGEFALPKVDLGDPTILASVTGGTPTADGWYTTTPTASYVCDDARSGVVLASCPRPEALPDGVLSLTRTVADVAGRTGSVSLNARVDTKPPPPPQIAVPQRGGAYEVGDTYTVSYACPPDATSGLAGCAGVYGSGMGVSDGATLDAGEPGNPGSIGSRTVTVVSVDAVGHRSSTSVDYRVVDTRRPTVPVLASPAVGAVTNQRTPNFTWAPSTDSGTGMKEYRINVGGKTYVLPASAASQAGFRLPDQLVDGTYEWQVFAVDQVGNTSSSPKRRFTVDPNAMAAPTITAGPQSGAATSSVTPTFAFTGLPGATFRWRTLTAADEEVPGGSGSGAGPVTLPALTDGTYSFSVAQVDAQGLVSEPAVALFRVDTVAPAAPRITAAPTTTADTQPSFAWAAAEPGGAFTWEVLNPEGTRVTGPGTTADTSVRLPQPLVAGAYVFRVRHTDPAGNAGPWSAGAPFTVLGGAAPPSGVSSTAAPTPPRRGLARPETRNATVLKPGPGARLNHRAVVLRWRKVPGASLYNVQVFRLNGLRYTKAFTAFPRGTVLAVPRGKLRPGQRYAWRVWPFMPKTGKYSARPFGISWFDTRRVGRS